jgi:hypothetical protein
MTRRYRYPQAFPFLAYRRPPGVGFTVGWAW